MLRLFFMCLVSLVFSTAARADVDDFEIPRLVIITGYEDNAMEPFLSRDGQWLFFNSRDEPGDETDLHHAYRLHDNEFEYRGKLKNVNTPDVETVPSMDRHGNFYFVSPRNYESSRNTLWQGRLSGGEITRIRELAGDVSRYNPLWLNTDAEVSADGRRLYVVENEWSLFGGGMKSSNLFVARKGLGGDFYRTQQMDEIFDAINTSDLEYGPALSDDELTLYFTRVSPEDAREGDATGFGIWMATRPAISEPFSSPVRIQAIEGYVESPTVADGGCAIYFHQKVRGVFRIMRAQASDCRQRQR